MSPTVTRLSLAVVLLAGCGVPPPPATPEPPPAPEPPPLAAPSPSRPCATKEACFAEGERAEKDKDATRAHRYFKHACELGHGGGCNKAAFSLAGDDKNEEKHALFLQACELGHDGVGGFARDGVGCFNAAEHVREREPDKALRLYVKGCAAGFVSACERGSLHALALGDDAAAFQMAGRGCDEKHSATCNTLGVLYAKGKGVPPDLDKASSLFKRACEAQDDNGCDNVKKLGGAGGGKDLDVLGANLDMSSLTADGFTMERITCRAEGGGLAALVLGPALGAVVASKRVALRACSPKGGEARVRFDMAGGRISAVEARAATPAIEACVIKALKTAAAPMKGTCAMTLRLGKK